MLKHGMARTATYRAWSDMKKRCSLATHADYARYGGRGITFCERWLRFENFLADMGERPNGMSLDRINNDGNYEPGNSRWATKAQQSRNNSRTRLLSFGRETLCISDWEKKLGMGRGTLRRRLIYGMSVEKAITTPIRDWGRSEKR